MPSPTGAGVSAFMLPSPASLMSFPVRMGPIRVGNDRKSPVIHAAVFCLLLAAGLARLAPPVVAQEARRALLEFRGQVTVPPGTVARGRRISASLVGVRLPFNKRVTADSRGRFRFKNLRPGTYSLSILIPGAGEVLRTVDVTASFADSRGRVERQFPFDAAALREQARPVPQGLVSVRELTISRRARSEYRRAQGRLERHDAEGAIQYLEKAVQEAPQYLEAWNNLGTIYFQRREYGRAEEYFRKALEQDADAFEPRVNLGGALLAGGRPEEALAINQEAQAARPQDPLANAQLGINYFLLGDYDEAIRHLEATKDLDPAHFSNPQITLAEIHLRLSKEGAALGELEDFLQHHPDAPEASSARATIRKIEQLQGETDTP